MYNLLLNVLFQSELKQWLINISFEISGVYEYIPNNNYNRTISSPYFDTAGERNVTSYAGQTTHLHCIVKDLGDKMVSLAF